MRADEVPDAHAPPYPEFPHGDEDDVRSVVGVKDGRHIAAVEERVGPLEKRLDMRHVGPRRKDIIVLKVAQVKAARDDGGRENGCERRSSWWSRLLWSE